MLKTVASQYIQLNKWQKFCSGVVNDGSDGIISHVLAARKWQKINHFLIYIAFLYLKVGNKKARHVCHFPPTYC